MASECQTGVVLPFINRAPPASARGEAGAHALEVSMVVPSGEALPATKAARPRCVRPAPFLPPPGASTAPLPTIAGCTLCNRSVAVEIPGSCPYWEHPSNRGSLAR